MAIEKKAFRQYNETKSKDAPMTLKINDKDKLMIEVGQYILNLESKGGVLKHLARVGVKVLLNQFSADDWHYLTNPERRRYQYKRPDIEKHQHEMKDFTKR